MSVNLFSDKIASLTYHKKILKLLKFTNYALYIIFLQRNKKRCLLKFYKNSCLASGNQTPRRLWRLGFLIATRLKNTRFYELQQKILFYPTSTKLYVCCI